jgi:hypothetical protein
MLEKKKSQLPQKGYSIWVHIDFYGLWLGVLPNFESPLLTEMIIFTRNFYITSTKNIEWVPIKTYNPFI